MTTEHDLWQNPESDPRLPIQHTLDVHQLCVLHRAIDALAFEVNEFRSTVPLHLAELIDATVSAWETVKGEMIAQPPSGGSSDATNNPTEAA